MTSILVDSDTSTRAAVLILDEDPSERELLSYWLVEEGFTVAAAGDRGEALELFHANPSALVILDPRLEAGGRLLADLRRINPALRCCLIGCEETLENVAHCFPKPLSLFDMTAVLWKLAAEVA